MSNGLLRKLRTLVLVTTLNSGAAAGDGFGPEVPAAWDEGQLTVLRSQKDPSRHRAWMLTPRGVVVVNHKPHESTAFVELPDWVWAGEAFTCPPDLALGPKGEALVSSNVVPTLWRIDPVTLRVTRHDLVIDTHLEKDVGFTGLTYAAPLGVFFGVSGSGALWRIDPLLRRAQHVGLSQPIRRPCGLAPLAANRRGTLHRLLTLCVQTAAGELRIHLAPDQRSAYVLPSCS